MSRIISFRSQRVLFTFAVFLIVLAFTTAVLWGHLDGILTGSYVTLAKAGLLLVPVVVLLMTLWELFVDKVGPGRIHALHPTVSRLVNWCFWGAILLTAAELVHAGALLKFESSTAQQQKTLAAVGDAQAKIAREASAGAIEASGKAAQELNARGQTRSAARTLSAGESAAKSAAHTAQEEIVRAAQGMQASTFLPDWYINGGMYVALPLLALFFFAITMFLARAADPYVDADDDGRPDVQQDRAPVRAPAPLPRPARPTPPEPALVALDAEDDGAGKGYQMRGTDRPN